MKIFSGNSNKELSRLIVEDLETELGKCTVSRFADGEVNVDIEESIRGQHCFIIQSTCPPVNESLMELLVIIDALKRASARSINAVIPYFGYARQDRKIAPRQPISARLVADLLTAAGITRVTTMDLHSGQIQGFFDIPVDNLYSKPIILDYIKENYSQENLVLVSPDAGGMARVRDLVKKLDYPIAMIDKRRSGPNKVAEMNVIGDVQDKTAFIIDDIVDTGGTLVKAAIALKEKGANKVVAFCTHGLLSGTALDNLCGNNSPFEELLVTNTIPVLKQDNYPKFKTLDVSHLFARAFRRIYKNESVSSLFV